MLFNSIEINVITNKKNKILSIAKAIFWTRYKDHDCELLSELETKENYFLFDDSFKKIRLSPRTGGKMLQIFGREICHLKIWCSSKVISQYIEKYVSDLLIKFEIGFVNDDTFYHIANSFEKVYELSITFNQYREDRAGNLSLSQLFPNLRRFSLKNVHFIDTSL